MITASKINNYTLFSILAFFLLGISLSIHVYQLGNITDFGNYYYGSKLLVDNKFSIEDYNSIYHFNKQIAGYGVKTYFENYIPVPPLTLLFYIPFCFVKFTVAKFLFNCISVAILTFSLLRLFLFLKLNNKLLIILPFIAFYPIYSNIYQGQTYILLLSFLIESYLSCAKTKYIKSGFFLSFVIGLKLFPIFILLYFILTKKYKVVLWTLLFVLGLYSITTLIVGVDIITNYFLNIIPRLLNNDIIGTYNYINESLYSLLLNLFCYDGINNLNPVINAPYLVPLLESACIAFILYFLLQYKNKNSFHFYGLVLFSLSLIGRYNPTYSLIFTIPFLLTVINSDKNTTIKTFYILIITALLNINFFLKSDFLPVRFFISAVLFCIVFCTEEYKSNIKYLATLFIITFGFKYILFTAKGNIDYFKTQNTKGILYNYVIKNDTLYLTSTTGNDSIVEKYKIKGSATITDKIKVINNKLFYLNRLICNDNSNKLKPCIYDDTTVIFMSDLNQAIGSYKLRYIRINE